MDEPTVDTTTTPAPPAFELRRVPGGRPNLNETAEEAAADAPGQAIRLQMQPEVFFRSTGLMKAWGGNIWSLEVPTVEELIAFRDDLDAFVRGWMEARRSGARG